jgi:2-oxoisovalerate dehydrogenase E2 component (dihydrolipoyl transacylase)
VGTPIIAIGADADVPAEPGPAAEPSTEPARREAMLVGYGPRTDAPTRRRRPSAPSRVASVDTERVRQPAPPAPTGLSPRPLAKPPVRKLAKDLGIDLADVPAAGTVVTRAEVEAFASSQTTATPAARPVATDDETRIPVKGVRKWTAEAMVRSAFTAPHVTEWVTVDVSRTMDLVARLKADRAFADVKVSPTLIAAKAICLAMRRTPQLNARWDEDTQEIVVKKAVNLGIAAATERGLVVPNIVGAESLSLVDLARAIGELTVTAREGRTQPAQMTGGTFSLTNIGVFGIDAGTPILNPGESGILALGSIERRPWVDEEDRVVPRWVTTLALSFDHRVVDGEQGSRFLADVAAILRDPAQALTF